MIESLISLDIRVFLFLNGLNSTWLNPIMDFVSGQFLWFPFIGLSLYFAFKQLSRKNFYLFILFLVLVLILSDTTSSYVLKNLTERLRPCREQDLKPLIYSFGQKCGGRFGFVSSHAANSLALTLFCLRTLKLPKAFFAIFLLLPFLVSYSRIYLGVHYPGDILGGLLVGTFWSSVYVFFWRNLSMEQDG